MRIHGENLDIGELFPNHRAEFARLQIREKRIEQENLADTFVQTLKCFGAAGGFVQIPARLTELLSQLPGEACCLG